MQKSLQTVRLGSAQYPKLKNRKNNCRIARKLPLRQFNLHKFKKNFFGLFKTVDRNKKIWYNDSVNIKR